MANIKDLLLQSRHLEKFKLQGICVYVSLKTRKEGEAIHKKPMKKGYVYIMANKKNGTLYTGVSGNLQNRVFAHKKKLSEGFTKKYNVTMLVYWEEFSSMYDAIQREKQIKSGSRERKIELIENINPDWQDLARDWFE